MSERGTWKQACSGPTYQPEEKHLRLAGIDLEAELRSQVKRADELVEQLTEANEYIAMLEDRLVEAGEYIAELEEQAYQAENYAAELERQVAEGGD